MNEKILEILRKNNYPDGDRDDDETCAIELEQLFASEVDRVIEERMPSDVGIMEEGQKRFTSNTGYLDSGKYEGFKRGCEWFRNQIKGKQ